MIGQVTRAIAWDGHRGPEWSTNEVAPNAQQKPKNRGLTDVAIR